jgi:PEP-CTERM motif-containing protein
MRLYSMPVLTILGLGFVSQATLGSTITTPSQSGITITTTVDTANHRVTYGFDLTAPAYDYEQIAFGPSPLPALTAIPLQSGVISSSGMTEWNFHQMYDNGGNFIDWQLELQYQTGSPPPRLNSVVINYNPTVQLSGNFVRLPGDDNVAVTFRRPAAGFPPGQDDNITLWAYVPEIVADTIPGDLDADGFVGITDLNIVLGNWNQTVPPGDPLAGDPTGDGFVGIEDLNTVLGNWNAGTPPTSNNIPEPATLAMFSLGLVLTHRRR